MSEYKGRDRFLDLPDNSFTLGRIDQNRLNRDMQIVIENGTGANQRVPIFANNKTNMLRLIKTGVIAIGGGIITLKANGFPFTIEDWLFDLSENPTQILSCDVDSDNALQNSQYFEITRTDVYKGAPVIDRVKLNRPELKYQQDSKKVSVEFDGLFSTAVTELAITIPGSEGVTTITTLNFQCGARLSNEYFLQESLRAARANGVAI